MDAVQDTTYESVWKTVEEESARYRRRLSLRLYVIAATAMLLGFMIATIVLPIIST